ncbi:MAG: S8 family serine peptidase [Gemmataceae bacterium]
MEPIFTIPPDLVRGPLQDDLYSLSGPANWGMAVFAVERLRKATDGTGITVGVIDTGADANHDVLRGQVIAAADFTGSSSGANDRNGHGTHTAATVAASDPEIGVAPGARLAIGKGLSDSGSGGGQGIAAAMHWCVDQGATILSMSLGSSGPDSYIQRAAVDLASKGIWIIAAAGNSGGGTPNVDFPGRFAETISIAALDENLRVASFSSAGAKIDGSGPGVGIWSAKPGGGYQQMSGTSMATPFIAGLLALYRSGLALAKRPIPSVFELRKILASNAVDVETPGVDRRTGPGATWPLLLANDLQPDFPAIKP